MLGFSMPIAWPAVAGGVVKGTAPIRAVSVRLRAAVATWLLIVVAVIVWNPGIGFFDYLIIIGYKYGICKEVDGINFAGFVGQRHRGGRQGGQGWCEVG